MSIKITDYEMSLLKLEIEDLTILQGSTHYIAPEVLKGEFNERSDEWSIGILLYILLSGEPPFKAPSDIEIFKLINKGRIQFLDKMWNRVSVEAKDLIGKLLTYNYHDRLIASEALKHPWFDKIQREGGAK
jgi:calcium-dependent protein kinase